MTNIILVADCEIRPSSYDPLHLAWELRNHAVFARVVALGYAGAEDKAVFGQASREELESAAYWKNSGADLVIAYYWWASERMLDAIREANLPLVFFMDSTGVFDPMITFPMAVRAYATALNAVQNRVRMIKAATHSLLHRKEIMAAQLRKMEKADLLVIETELFRKRLASFFRSQGRPDLADRIRVVSHSAKKPFTSILPGSQRKEQVVGACHWLEAGKNARGWFAAIKKALAAQPNMEATAFGAKGNLWIEENVKGASRLALTPWIPATELAGAFSEARILFSASWSESLPIVALEALCSGCTIVAPPIDGFRSLGLEEGFGTLARSHSTRHLCEALQTEWREWEAGHRDPVRIANEWRQRVGLQTVAEKWAVICGEILAGQTHALKI